MADTDTTMTDISSVVSTGKGKLYDDEDFNEAKLLNFDQIAAEVEVNRAGAESNELEVSKATDKTNSFLEEDTGNYESASENGADSDEPAEEESELEVVSDNDTSFLSAITHANITCENDNANGILTDKMNGNDCLEQNNTAGNGTISSPNPEHINWNEYEFPGHDQNSSLFVNNSFSTPTPQRNTTASASLSWRQRLSETMATTRGSLSPPTTEVEESDDSPLSSSRSAPPDLSITDSLQELNLNEGYSNNTTREADSTPAANVSNGLSNGHRPRIGLSSPLQASTPNNNADNQTGIRARQAQPNEQEDEAGTSAVADLEVSNNNDESVSILVTEASSTNGDNDSATVATEPESSTHTLDGTGNSTCSIKKKNSVSFDPIPVDIEEVLSSRPPSSTSVSTNATVGHSILVNGGAGHMQNVLSDISDAAHFSGAGLDAEQDDDDEPMETSNIIVDELKMAELSHEEERQILNNLEIEIKLHKDTVTVQTLKNGVKVYLIGTVPFSQDNQNDIIKIIRKVEPKVVVLGLCENRRTLLALDDNIIFNDIVESPLVNQTGKEGGILKGLFQYTLTAAYAQMAERNGIPPGEEFRVAALEANRIRGCKIMLGDRAYEITIGRLDAATNIFQKVILTRWLLNSNPYQQPQLNVTNQDFMDRMLLEMGKRYPDLTSKFIQERDIYFSNSLRRATIATKTGGTIVGVVDKSHVQGILKYFENSDTLTDDEIAELSRVPEPSIQRIIIKSTFKLTLYLLIGYGMFKLSKTVLSSDFVTSRASKLSVHSLWVKNVRR